MAKQDGIQQRQYFRLRYPESARPMIRVQGKIFSVSETSEKGLRVKMGHVASLYCGLKMKAVVSLHDDVDVIVEGSILRFDDNNEVVIKLVKGLSFKNMVSEQRYVRQRFSEAKVRNPRQNLSYAP
ncbi:PilZ domain-containing protein [Vibrio salinus]|uniref:PilZ domain-containing protein n=1 Tax=Vibrio salinus TaxID=2899784 RepID=UPI001E30D936|nr:PilZ domain-containing protein [Vibrio salinus]MCE0493134.1 PilZ domain-containing protein [Vibrio salinus]